MNIPCRLQSEIRPKMAAPIAHISEFNVDSDDFVECMGQIFCMMSLLSVFFSLRLTAYFFGLGEFLGTYKSFPPMCFTEFHLLAIILSHILVNIWKHISKRNCHILIAIYNEDIRRQPKTNKDARNIFYLLW